MPAGENEDGSAMTAPTSRYANLTFSFNGYLVNTCQQSREAYRPSVIPEAPISASDSEATVPACVSREGAASPIEVEENDDVSNGYEADDEGTFIPVAVPYHMDRPILPPRRIDFDVQCQIRDGCKFCEYGIPHGRLRSREPSLYHLHPFRMTSPAAAGAPPQDDLARRLIYHIDALSRWDNLELEPQTLADIRVALGHLR